MFLMYQECASEGITGILAMGFFGKSPISTLRRIPVIVLDPKYTHTAELARVTFTTVTYGINVPSPVYRPVQVMPPPLLA
jgi:formylmethanofuran dehydrogenase subunit B